MDWNYGANLGANIEQSHKYAAFISYAHADERVAKRLHVALETYPLPKGMDKAERSKLFPVFRDVTELTAHHSLSEKIRDAVKTSRFLIVLCSPASKKSHWVNEEIKLFRKLHGEGSILAVIVEGVPDTAFPPALTADGREPLAANMATNEGFRFGVTQLAASMLGVGLDRLVQRDQRRRRIRTQLVTGVTTALAIIMGGLAWTAIDARDEAEEALGKAEVSRNEAEKMVEFMIGDLKDDLTPIQKLDLFDNIGKRVSDYYDGIPFADMDDDRLMRKARTLHLLGDVEINRGNYDNAEEILRDAYLITEDVYIRNSENSDAIFSHAQSEYWMGELYQKQYLYEEVIPFWTSYSNLGLKLLELDANKVEWLMEAAWGFSNLGLTLGRLKKFEDAEPNYISAIIYFKQVIKQRPGDATAFKALANTFEGASIIEERLNRKNKAIEYRKNAEDIYNSLLVISPDNKDLQFRLIQSKFRLLKLKIIKVCNNPKYEILRGELTSLVNYDLQNKFWNEELFIHYHSNLSSCLDANEYSYAQNAYLKYIKVRKSVIRNNYVDELISEMETNPDFIKLVRGLN